MKKFSALFFTAFCAITGFSQTVTGKLNFQQGQSFEITMNTKTNISQQAMGQAIDFVVDANAVHGFKVTNATADNSTLNHHMQAINFSWDGMGQKKSFASNNEKDLNGPMGKIVKDILDKKYDIIVDTGGTVLMAMPEKITLAAGDSRMAIITSMLKEVMVQVQPPLKGKACFFKVFPAGEAGVGATWTTSEIADGGKIEAAYVIKAITDSTILVDFAENSTSVTKTEMMGSEATTTLNNKSKGSIVINRMTGIMKEKTIATESTGNMEASFGSLPVTSKSTTTITVKPVMQ